MEVLCFSQATQEYAEYITKRHTAFKSYRDATISKWSEKTRLASGKLNSKVSLIHVIYINETVRCIVTNIEFEHLGGKAKSCLFISVIVVSDNFTCFSCSLLVCLTDQL